MSHPLICPEPGAPTPHLQPSPLTVTTLSLRSSSLQEPDAASPQHKMSHMPAAINNEAVTSKIQDLIHHFSDMTYDNTRAHGEVERLEAEVQGMKRKMADQLRFCMSSLFPSDRYVLMSVFRTWHAASMEQRFDRQARKTSETNQETLRMVETELNSKMLQTSAELWSLQGYVTELEAKNSSLMKQLQYMSRSFGFCVDTVRDSFTDSGAASFATGGHFEHDDRFESSQNNSTSHQKDAPAGVDAIRDKLHTLLREIDPLYVPRLKVHMEKNRMASPAPPSRSPITPRDTGIPRSTTISCNTVGTGTTISACTVNVGPIHTLPVTTKHQPKVSQAVVPTLPLSSLSATTPEHRMSSPGQKGASNPGLGHRPVLLQKATERWITAKPTPFGATEPSRPCTARGPSPSPPPGRGGKLNPAWMSSSPSPFQFTPGSQSPAPNPHLSFAAPQPLNIVPAPNPIRTQSVKNPPTPNLFLRDVLTATHGGNVSKENAPNSPKMDLLLRSNNRSESTGRGLL